MLILLCWIICSIYILLKSNKKIYNIIILNLTFALFLILFNPDLCISCAHYGINLFYKSVFPSLFPFTVITSLILSFNGLNVYSRLFGNFLCKPLHLPSKSSFPLLVSLICGFPLGAQFTGVLCKEKQLTRDDATTTLIAASNCSPLFVIGIVGSVLLKNVLIGYVLFVINVLTCYITSYFFSKRKSSFSYYHRDAEFYPPNMGSAIKKSIDSALKTSLVVCAYITFFSVMIGYFKHYINIFFPNIPELFSSFILGLVELTNGVTTLSQSSLSLTIKLPLISFLISFSGLSIFSQVYSLIYNENISFKLYFVAKIVQGFISALITFMVVYIFSIRYTSFSSITLITTFKSFEVVQILDYSYLFLLILAIIPYTRFLNNNNRVGRSRK